MTDKFENPFLPPQTAATSGQEPTGNPAGNLTGNLTGNPTGNAIGNPFNQSAVPTPPQAPVSPLSPDAPASAQMPSMPQAPAIQPITTAQQPQQPQQPKPVMPAAQTQPASAKPNPFDFANQESGNRPPGGQTPGSQTPGNRPPGGQAPSGQPPAQSGAPAKGERLRYIPLAFTGRVGEYYGVLLLNILLTFITLGIYAPWAKVRKARYFHSHTELLDEGFQFTATGKQLLIGRLVALLALVAFSAAEFIPVIGVWLSAVVILFGLPFILNRSVRFKARIIAWRDVRFGWHGSYGMACLVWMIYPLLTVITLGLAQPIAARALRRHYAENHLFGGAKFSADLSLGAFYLALLKALFFFLFLGGLFGGIGALMASSTLGDMVKMTESYDEFVLRLAFMTDEQKLLLALPFIGIGFAFFMASQYYFALARHVMINHLRLQGGIRFRSRLSGFSYAMVMLSNLLFNLISLGFAYPYTVVRRYRFLTKSIEIRPINNMVGFVDTQMKAGFSVFEEASDIEGLSVDI